MSNISNHPICVKKGKTGAISFNIGDIQNKKMKYNF